MKAIHASSKAFKHLRAVVSLAHDRLGDETCRREDEIFGDADRALAGVRHARVMADMHDAVTSRSGQRANAMAFPPWALVASRIGRCRQQPQTAARTRGTREAEVLVELWPTVGSAPRLIATGVEPAADRTGSAVRRFAVLGVMESVRARGCDRPQPCGHDARAVAVRRPELVSHAISMGVDLQAMFHCSVPTLAALEAARRALARTGHARREECLTYRCQCTFTDESFAPFPATGSG